MDFAATLLLGLICIAIGVLIGALLFHRPGKSVPDTLTDRTTPQSVKGGVILQRDRRSQRLSVEVDGDVYQSAGPLSPDRRRLLSNLAADFSTWLGILPASLPEESPASPSQGEPSSPAARTGAEATPRVESGQETIAAQIDAILQDQLEGTTLAGRGLKILELPGQGMVVMVGLDKYTDLEQVGDPDVRQAIGQAVAEWEARNTFKK